MESSRNKAAVLCVTLRSIVSRLKRVRVNGAPAEHADYQNALSMLSGIADELSAMAEHELKQP